MFAIEEQRCATHTLRRECQLYLRENAMDRARDWAQNTNKEFELLY